MAGVSPSPSVPPPGYLRRSEDGTPWRWDGIRWIPEASPRAAKLAKSSVVVGIIELALAPLAALGMMEVASAGGVLGVGDAILAVAITSPAVVLGLRAIAAGPAPGDRAEAKGGIIMGATVALLLLALIAMSRL